MNFLHNSVTTRLFFHVYFNKICSQPTGYCPNHRFFIKKILNARKFIYIPTTFCASKVKNFDPKTKTTNWYKSVRSESESTWSKLNSPNKLRLLFFPLGMISLVSVEAVFFLVQLVSKIQLVSVSTGFVPFSRNCQFPETHWGPSLAPYSSCVHLCGL